MDTVENGWTSYWRIPLERTTITHAPHYGRLYCKGRVLGHKRAKRNTRPNTSLIQIEGVSNKEDAQFYLGKVHTSTIFREPLFYDLIFSFQRVAYVYRAKREIQGSKIRVIWGCVYNSRISFTKQTDLPW